MPIVQVKRDGFYKPQVVNDWGYVGYFLKAVKSASGTWGLSEQDPKMKLKAGDKVIVRWPDKSESEETLKGRPYSTYVSDMGASSQVSGTHLVVEVNYRGIKTDVPIGELWLKRPGNE